uniref:Putative ribonuclease H-like domain-containing protein n=1 Tax=Tanacetum cinerariifolium TaxID=118510 RepID=A0A6L2KPH7_TANCI|nr:putative ribonuclease H-like domain-containing protein [Tanacetum cinerariifolium]
MKVEESLNVTFDKSPPPTKLSPFVDDDVGEEEAIRNNTKVVYNNNEEDKSIKVDEVVNIKESKNHPLGQVIENLNQRTLRPQAQNHSNFFCFIPTIEPKDFKEALKDESWVVAIQEELNQFVANDVWDLVPLPMSQSIIGTQWVFRNNLDENGRVSRNKAKLVAQGYNNQEGVDYDETYASIARLESIRILLAIACTNDFKLYQMDIKSAFLNGFINEEVYVAQPLGFIDFQKPNYVYKLKKALYGLKQAPKACFAKIMHDEFEMSMMGGLNFFLGFQIKQIDDGIFFDRSKYIKEMLKKFGLEDSKPTKTLMSMEIKLTKDDEADSVDSSKYQDMMGSLLYLTAKAVKRIFSDTHLIKDCDFHEKQMANKTIGIGVDPVYNRNKVNYQNQSVPQVVHLRTGKVNIPPVRPQPFPTGKPKVSTPVPTGKPKVSTPVLTGKPKMSTPVPTGRLNRLSSFPTDRGYSPFVISGWWSRIDGQQLLSPQQVVLGNCIEKENPFSTTTDEGIFYSGCSRSMTGNKARLDDFQAFHGGKVTFRGGEGRISGKGTIRTPTLDFENVYYIKELQQFNLFSISQICDKKNQVLFTDTECLVLSKDFKLPDESMVVLRVPKKQNLYSINLNNLCPMCNLACLVAHSSFDESMKWHRFCWVFFLEHKDETYPILMDFITLVENQLNKKVKDIRSDKGTEFKNAHMIELCGSKGIKREYSNPRTPQQNRIAERKNRTLIEVARTMLADSKLPTMFWTEAVRTTCYVLNRVSVTSPLTKTPYALLTGNIPSVSHFKPFGCYVTILNTSDHLGKFDGKADEGYIVGYSASNKAYRVYNVPNKRVEESMNLRFLEEKPNVQGLSHEWYFDLDYLTDSLGYKHVPANQSAGTHGATTNSAGTQDADSDSDCNEQVIIVPYYPSLNIQQSEPKDTFDQQVTFDDESLGLGLANNAEELQTQTSAKTFLLGCIPVPTSKVPVPTGSIPVPAAATKVSTDDILVHTSSSTDSIFDDEPTTRFSCPSDLGNHDPSPGIFSSSSYDDEFGIALNNVASTVELFKRGARSIARALEDPSWVDAMQEEMQQFKFQNVWVLVDLPAGKYVIGTKWILKNKRDARGIVVRNKARLVAQGHRHEEGIDYDEVFALVARIEAIRLFLVFASYMGFLVYQMDVKSVFLYERIDEEVYVTQPKGTIDKTLFLKKNNRDIILVQVYVDDIIFGSIKKAWCDEFEALMRGEFQTSAMGELTFILGLQVQERPDGIFIHQDKYVQEIMNKFDLGSVRTATTPYEALKPKSNNESDSLVNVHLYRSMIGSLMYLTASRPDIMFTVSACLRNQVTPTTSNLEAVKKIFKYLKGQPKLGLWYPKESPLVLEAYSDSDYAGANKDIKSTTGRCQFLGTLDTKSFVRLSIQLYEYQNLY